jgi:hypothetical protein
VRPPGAPTTGTAHVSAARHKTSSGLHGGERHGSSCNLSLWREWRRCASAGNRAQCQHHERRQVLRHVRLRCSKTASKAIRRPRLHVRRMQCFLPAPRSLGRPAPCRAGRSLDAHRDTALADFYTHCNGSRPMEGIRNRERSAPGARRADARAANGTYGLILLWEDR